MPALAASPRSGAGPIEACTYCSNFSFALSRVYGAGSANRSTFTTKESSVVGGGTAVVVCADAALNPRKAIETIVRAGFHIERLEGHAYHRGVFRYISSFTSAQLMMPSVKAPNSPRCKSCAMFRVRFSVARIGP